MPTRDEILYFGAGPARLPTSVLTRAAAAIVDYESTGIGLVEHSHRSSLSSKILSDAQNHLRQLLDVPDDYSVIFMQGGGTTQFSAVVYNLVGYFVQTELNKNGGDIEAVRRKLKEAKIDYVITGGWSQKASEEAKRLVGEEMVNIAINAKEKNGGKYGLIPGEEEWRLSEEGRNIFSYYCDNETVDGVEFPGLPKALEGKTVACDMSSNILSRKVDVSKYSLIFVCLPFHPHHHDKSLTHMT
jgi:phosphoserine aminotransferase